MTSNREKFFIVTPDTLYGTLLKAVTFPNFETRVVKGLDQIKLSPDFKPDGFLIFYSHLDEEEFRKIITGVQKLCPAARIFKIEGKTNSQIEQVWPESRGRLGASSIDDIDLALRKLSVKD